MRPRTALLGFGLILLAAACPADEPNPRPRHPANRLAGETSPYLLQHAHNPVDWYPWGPEAFAKAKQEGKPIFLSVGYSSCYWCHVMERECFENEAIAKTLNEHFVCVKVDREERPDVDQVYMAALQAFAGSGGWPMSVFLFPDGRPFFAGTYYPAKGRDGLPGFPEVLAAILDAWKDHRPELEKDGDNLAAAVRRGLAGAARRKVPLTRAMAAEGKAALAEQFDPDFGGFGYDPNNPKRPKFPEPSNLAFLLDRHRRNPAPPAAPGFIAAKLKGPDALAMALTTFDRMARGGIRDQVGGGYHRYSVDRGWNVPHFEKMLYDNAQLASVLLQAYEITDDPRWKVEAGSILAFVARELTAPGGGFLSAIDAGAPGEEGHFYTWTRDEVGRILGDGDDFKVFAEVYGLDRGPNFEDDRYVLSMPRPLPTVAAALDTAPEDLEKRLAPLRARLLAAREGRPKPSLDEKVLTSWNGLMIAAYADASRILDEPRHREPAGRAAEYLWKTHRDADGRLLRTSRDGKAKLPGYLDDYAFLAHGLLRLHAATGESKWLDRARGLVDRMRADFEDEEAGGFFFTADDHESLLARAKDPYDGALPSGNSMAVRVLVDLAAATGDDRYLDAAGKALAAFSSTLAVAPTGVPQMLVGLESYLDARPGGSEPAVAGAGQEEGQDAVVVAEAAPAGGAKPTPGGAFDATIALSIKAGYHLYANIPDRPTPRAAVVVLPGDAPATLLKVEYPAGEAKALAGEDEKVPVYEGKVTIKARVQLAEGVEPGPLVLNLQLRYIACTETACLAPAKLTVPLEVDVAR